MFLPNWSSFIWDSPACTRLYTDQPTKIKKVALDLRKFWKQVDWCWKQMGLSHLAEEVNTEDETE